MKKKKKKVVRKRRMTRTLQLIDQSERTIIADEPLVIEDFDYKT